jgi:hypothetical protein
MLEYQNGIGTNEDCLVYSSEIDLPGIDCIDHLSIIDSRLFIHADIHLNNIPYLELRGQTR